MGVNRNNTLRRLNVNQARGRGRYFFPTQKNEFDGHYYPHFRWHNATGRPQTGEGIINGSMIAMDYADFPALQYYINKYETYPGIIKHEALFSLENIYNCARLYAAGGLYIERKGPVRNFRDSKKTIETTSITFESESQKMLFMIIFDIPENSTKKHINLGVRNIAISCFHDNSRTADEVLEIIKTQVFNIPEIEIDEDDSRGFVNILALNGNSGFSLSPYKTTVPEIDFDLNYNEDFKEIHRMIETGLSANNSKGLVLLHGQPGTGKTTYVRYLISVLKKKVIFVPPNMTNTLSEPALIKFMLDNSNSILVIEDAENVLGKRTGGEQQAVANILNLTDGLLSDCAHIQIIATFNTDINKIDEALLRKGRLIARYEFKPLTNDRAEALGKKLGIVSINEHTLADIYNAADSSFKQEKRTIGFK